MSELENVISTHESTTATVKVHRGGNVRYSWPLCRQSSRLSVAGFYETAPAYLVVDCKRCLKLP